MHFGVRLTDLANKKIQDVQLDLSFRYTTNNFYHKYVPNIAWGILILKLFI